MKLSTIEQLNQVLYKANKKLSHIRNQSAKASLMEIVHWVMETMYKTVWKSEITEYIDYVVTFSSNSEMVDGNVKMMGAATPFVVTAAELDLKLKETFPKFHQKAAKKYLYARIKARTESLDPSVQYGLKPFLGANELMILNAPDDPIVGLKVILEQGDARRRILKEVKKILLLPAMYALIFIALVHVLQDEMINMFLGFAEKLGTEPTIAVVRMNAVNSFVINNLHEIIVFAFLTVFIYSWLNHNSTGRLRGFIENIPMVGSPVKQSRLIQSGLLLQSIALLYTSGVNTKRALQLITENTTPFVKSKVKEMISVHRATGSDIEAFRSDIFDLDIQFKLSIYFELTDPSSNMNTIARAIFEEIEEKIKKFAFRVNMFSIVMLGLYLLLFVDVYMTNSQMLPSR